MNEARNQAELLMKVIPICYISRESGMKLLPQRRSYKTVIYTPSCNASYVVSPLALDSEAAVEQQEAEWRWIHLHSTESADS